MIGFEVKMKKYLWIILFFVTTLCFAQTNAAINQANTDNNLVIQLVDSKLVNLDNKVAAVVKSNQDGIADLKARTDEKLADKFKQLDDRAGDINFWFTLISFIGAILGIVIPLIVLVVGWFLNRRINKNIEDSKEELDLFRKDATFKIKDQLEYAEKLLALIKENHSRSKQLTAEYEALRQKPPSEVTNKNRDGIAAISKATKEQPEDQLTANDWFIRGLNAQEQNEFYEAITYYNSAIKLNPLSLASYNNRGNAKAKLGNYSEALSDYNKAIELNLKDVDAYFNKACAYALMKNKPEALNWLDKALQLAYPVNEVLDDGDWKIYLDDPDFEDLITKYNK